MAVLGPPLATAFGHATLTFGALLVLGVLVSIRLRASFLTLTPAFVLIGLALGPGGTGFLSFSPGSEFVVDLASVALIVLLFRDGLEVDGELLRREWHLPARKLIVAMPITAALVALAAKAFTDLSWTEAFLLGALLSPTDPVLSSRVITNPRVPRLIRHSLNLESGLNDGLALAPVLALLASLQQQGQFTWWHFILQDVGLGFAYGATLGFAGSLLLPGGGWRGERATSPHLKVLYTLGVAFATYGVAVTAPHGNGFIAVFVCAIVLGIRRPDIRETFTLRAEDLIEIVKLGVFVVFGSLLTVDGLFSDGLAAVGVTVATLLIARPVAVWLALAGTGRSAAEKGFMAWFGPKGVATMTYSLLVITAGIGAGSEIFDLAALCVVVSVLAHGLTDAPGIRWIERHRPLEEAPAAPMGAA